MEFLGVSIDVIDGWEPETHGDEHVLAIFGEHDIAGSNGHRR